MVFKEYKGLDLPTISSEILNFWEEHQIFEKVSPKEKTVPLIFFTKARLRPMGCREFTTSWRERSKTFSAATKPKKVIK